MTASPATPTLPRLARPLGGARFLGKHTAMLVGGGIVACVILLAVFGPLLYSQDPNHMDFGNSLSGPSPQHPLGTDGNGRDLLARLLHGGRLSLVGPLAAITIATVVGIGLGLLAAWYGGLLDSLLQRLLDTIFAIPGILLAILFAASFGRGLTAPVAAMAIAFTPFIAQLVRSATLQEKTKPYLDAYRVLGFSELWIAARRLLPNIAPVVLAQATINLGYAVMVLGSLSFLGFGVPPPDPDWGRMVAEGQEAMQRGAYLPSLLPSLAMIVTVVGFALLGEGFADRLARRERG